MTTMKNDKKQLQVVDTEYRIIQELIHPVVPSENLITKCIMKLKSELVDESLFR